MKQLSFRTFMMAIVLYAGVSFVACKSKDSGTTNTDTAPSMMEPKQDNATVRPDTAQVMISPNDSLTNMAKDAVKDYPGVTANVSNGEVTLTGDITRAKLPKLMMAVQAMHPKKVNNNLTIK